MNLAQKSMPAESRRLLDQHLDAIERVLAQSGLARSERRAICDEVETQAIEMASSRSGDDMTITIMQSVIAELDPPEGYRQHDDSASVAATPLAQHPQKISPFALGSIILPIVAVMLILSADGALGIFSILGGVSVISFLLASLAIRDMRYSPSKIGGLGFAVFGMLVIPLLVMNFLAFWLSATISEEVVNPSVANIQRYDSVRRTAEAQAIHLKQQTTKLENNADNLGLNQEAKEANIALGTAATRESLDTTRMEESSLTPTAWDRRIVKWQYVIMIALVASFLTISGAISIFIYRRVYRHYLNQPVPMNPVAMMA